MVAIGGNSLLHGTGRATIEEQFEAARHLAVSLRELLQGGWRLLLTHGNGPQVGFIQRRSDLLETIAPELPTLKLDMCVADSQGSIGYILANTLASEVRRGGGSTDVVAMLTHTVVDPADPAFSGPTKPIGSFYTEQVARSLARENGWVVAEDSGRGWRRLVASPRPQRILEERAIAALLSSGFAVVGAGGGGIPVVEEADGGYRGVEAVIDKDLSSALLARQLCAHLFVITTGVPQVAVNFGLPEQRYLDVLEADQARELAAQGQFAPGSMGPKIEAALQFVASGGMALITSPGQLGAALEGKTGTRVIPSRPVN